MRKLKKPKSKPKLDISVLNNDRDTRERYAVEVKNRFEQLSNEDRNNTTAEDDWKHIEDALIHWAQQIIPQKARDKKQKWMNDDIIELMKKRRSVKS